MALRSRRNTYQIGPTEMAANARNYVAPSGGENPLSSDDYLVIEGLRPVGHDGVVIEHHPVLHVRRDIFRGGDRKGTSFTPYQAIVHCEENGLFLASAALTCNILAYLCDHKADPVVAGILGQYKDHGSGHGWHAQNTVVQWKQGQGTILHYPRDTDFPSSGGEKGINDMLDRVSLPFEVDSFASISLEEALRLPHYSRFLQNLTGLADPSVLVSLGRYFPLPAKVWVPHNVGRVNTTRSVWLGCGSNSVNLIANDNLYDNSAARGVGEPQASVSAGGSS